MKYLTLLVALFCLSTHSIGQSLGLEVIASSGDYYTDSNGDNLHWTLGELMTERYENGDLLTQGFHQTFVVSTQLFENSSSEFDIQVYPNPFLDRLTIETTAEKPLNAQLLNIYGQVVAEKSNITENDLLSFSSFTAGTYLLVIRDETGILKTFKLQKINF